jgi:hypothetical protein
MAFDHLVEHGLFRAVAYVAAPGFASSRFRASALNMGT